VPTVRFTDRTSAHRPKRLAATNRMVEAVADVQTAADRVPEDSNYTAVRVHDYLFRLGQRAAKSLNRPTLRAMRVGYRRCFRTRSGDVIGHERK
jgi:hypothetical protein